MRDATRRTADRQLAYDPGSKPVTHLQKSLAMAWCLALGSPVGLDTDFFKAGGTKAGGEAIVSRVQELVGRGISLQVLAQYPTVGQLAKYLERSSGNLRWTNLVEVRAEGDRTPVVCVHCDEDNYHFAHLLPAAHPFLAFFHQGEDGKAMTWRTFPSIAAHYAQEIQEARPTGPLVICGYSYGGDISIELARHLRNSGRDVPLLILLDSRSPLSFRRRSLKDRLLSLRDVGGRVRCAGWFAKGLPLPEHLRVFYLMNRYGKAMRHYDPQPWPGRTLLVRSQKRTSRPHQWGGICPDLHIAVVPGTHRSIITAEGTGPVVEAIQREMAELAL